MINNLGAMSVLEMNIIAKETLEYLGKACFTLIVRPFGRAFLSWVTERRGRETDRRQFHTKSHLT